MKRVFLHLTVIACLLAFSTNALGQAIKVDNNGRVGINGEPSSPIIDNKLEVHGNMAAYNIGCSGLNAGNGNISGVNKLVVSKIEYGSPSLYGSISIGNSSGTIKINGGNEAPALYVAGSAYCSAGFWSGSDVKLKKNIDTLNSNDILSKIQKIKGKKYNFKSREELLSMHKNKQVFFQMDTMGLENELDLNTSEGSGIVGALPKDENDYYEEIITRNGKKYGIKINIPQLPKKKQYGLIAQEIKDEFPELVRFDSTSMLYAINYEGFIPIILEAVKVQQKQINKMGKGKETIKKQHQDIQQLKQLVGQQQQAINQLQQEMALVKAQCCAGMLENAGGKKNKKSGTVSGNPNDDTKNLEASLEPSLEQNSPNPFTEETVINYYLPKETSQATLYIYDMQGKPVDNHEISRYGQASYTLKARALPPGMYLYTLVADGKEVGTRRMMLTE